MDGTDEGQELYFISPSSLTAKRVGLYRGEKCLSRGAIIVVWRSKEKTFSQRGCWENHLISAPKRHNQLTIRQLGVYNSLVFLLRKQPFAYVNLLHHCPSPQLMCSSVQAALFEEEERGRKLQERLAAGERRNRQLKERVRKVKRSLRNARKAARKAEQEVQELQERLKAAERRAGHHLNAIMPEEPQHGRYASTAIRQRMQL